MAAFPTVEVLNPEQLNEGKDIKTDVGLLMAVISKINWREPFLISLMIIHLFILSAVVWCRKRPYVLAVFLLVLGLLCMCSEYINQWAAANSHHFMSDQYFDSSGLFISVIFSLPLLLQCFIILICLLLESCSIMQEVAILKLKNKQKSSKQSSNNNDNNKKHQ